MRELGPFEKRPSGADMAGARKWPKPDFVNIPLNAQELHAYYIAVISAEYLAVASN